MAKLRKRGYCGTILKKMDKQGEAMMTKNDIFDYAKQNYGTEPEYLWKSYPDYAILRYSGNRKWYGIVMNIPGEKAGLSGSEKLDVLEVKCDPLLIGSLLGKEGYFPAYHMNKSHWIGIRLDGVPDDNEVLRLLDLSYGMVKGKRSGKK